MRKARIPGGGVPGMRGRGFLLNSRLEVPMFLLGLIKEYPQKALHEFKNTL
jgi:hypothetical protein